MTSSVTVPRGRHTILLVDDDPAVGGMLEEYLTEELFEVVHVCDSMAALGLIERGRRIDLLLADLAMPPGMPNGVSLAMMVRLIIQDIAVVFMTGYPRLLEAAGELPGKVFIKPFDLAELAQEIRDLLAD
jgi:CheY-like chemotaxis protein